MSNADGNEIEKVMTVDTFPSKAHADARDFAGEDVRPRGGQNDPAQNDPAMIRAAAELTRDLTAPNPAIYWGDMLVSAVVGYGAMALALYSTSALTLAVFGVISMLALFRAGSFIHEITHIKHAAVPGFRLGWNMLVGVPLLVPSFMYEGVHSLHHARTRYGTAEDPEYLPLALMRWYTVPLFVVVSILAPVALLIRYAVLTPLSAIIPPLRKLVVERYSGLVINPAFRRRPAEGDLRRNWHLQEGAASLWAIGLIIAFATGFIPVRSALIILAIVSGSIVINQIRTLVAHLWENDGNVMTVTEQFLDSVNIPQPAVLPALWAPVGLRYHALHHLLPGLPYHALGEAHRRMKQALAPDSRYHSANYRGLFGLVKRLVTHAGQAR
jgi:fatty acid desaturase